MYNLTCCLLKTRACEPAIIGPPKLHIHIYEINNLK